MSAPLSRRVGGPLAALLLAACARGSVVRAPEPERGGDRGGSGGALDYLRARDLMVPVAGVAPDRLRDSFGDPRSGGRTHRALDIMAPRLTPVVAADDGRVLAIRSNRLGGLTVYTLDPDERFVYYYAHLDSFREGLAPGERLRRGDVLGYVGTTGNAPAHVPHLHFQVMHYQRRRYWDGEPVNPIHFLVRPGAARPR